MVFIYGAAGLVQYTDQCVGEPAVRDLRRKVTVEEDPKVPVESAFVTAHATDGRRFECHVTQSRGMMARPMSNAELDSKFRSLAAYGASTLDAERLIAAIWAIDDKHDVAGTVKMMVQAQPTCLAHGHKPSPRDLAHGHKPSPRGPPHGH